MNTLSKMPLAAAGSDAGLQLARTIVRRSRYFDWNHKRIVVAGGSQGPGLFIARQLADQLTQEILSLAAIVLPAMGGIGRDAAKG